jgi:membrane associated rhomboid family serine protease
MSSYSERRTTPWVLRLIVANAVVQLFLLTVFTSDAVPALLAFNPSTAFVRPWTWVSYMFVHAGLYVLGPAVESRMGSRAFLLYYLYCGVGGAAASLALNGIQSGPIIGASGAVLGVAMAFAMLWPDAEMIVFPFPFPVRAWMFVALLVGLDIFGALSGPRDGVAHFAHLGGAAFGFLFFRLQAYHRRTPAPVRSPVETAVMVQSGSGEQRPGPHLAIPREPEVDPLVAELDRLLDKISAQGLQSLTLAERRFLDEVARRKKGEELH